MWCLPCFKPSTSEDPFEAETNLLKEISRQEADTQEAAQLASAIQESSRLHQQEQEEERRRTRLLEVDAQIANGFIYEERERQLNIKSALEDDDDEQLTKTILESLKEKGKGHQFEDEQVKKDKQLALIVQESLNMAESPPQTEDNKTISRRALLEVDEQLDKAVMESLKEKWKGKQFEDEQVKKDEQLALIVQESLNMVESPPRLEENKDISTSAQLDEDEQRIIWESLKGKGQVKQSNDDVEEDGKLPKVNPPRSICGGCNSMIEHGRSVNVLGVSWHPKCLVCHSCDRTIAIQEVVSNGRGNFHKSCYERYCYVCKGKIRKFGKHPFWEELYCLAHEADGTPKCCSCERLEVRGTNYVMLGDDRWLCLDCMDSAVMDSDECQPLHFEIREYFEGLNMKVDKQFPFLLVEKHALNKAEKEEKIYNQNEVLTRGICLSEEQNVISVSKKAKIGPNKQLIGMTTESQRVVRECEVTAILILYGLPRLLTGYILAHEMMHAYLRVNGHRNLDKVLEEGICQVLGYMWLESQTYSTTHAEASSSASSSSSRAPTATKKGEWSCFEKKLVEFCKYQIETDESKVYGEGFRRVNKMMTNLNIKETLKEIIEESRKHLKR